jgi:hypothetical protein
MSSPQPVVLRPDNDDMEQKEAQDIVAVLRWVLRRLPPLHPARADVAQALMQAEQHMKTLQAQQDHRDRLVPIGPVSSRPGNAGEDHVLQIQPLRRGMVRH